MTRVPIPTVTDWALSADLPLVLLPVRLETRFFGDELRVRIFPDEIHVDSHIPELTDAEIIDATAYWQQVGSGPQDAATPAWAWLCRLYGAPRASWIARVMEPVGGVLPTPARAPLNGSDRAPQARALPTRWYAVGVRAGHDPVIATSNRVADDLTVGPAWAVSTSSVPPEHVALDTHSRWLVDYQEAERTGMAVTLPLGKQLATEGLDELFVFGVDETAAPDESARVLSALFEAHASTSGLAFPAAGTPTNLTGTSALTEQSPGAVGASDAAPASSDANASRIGALLGIPTRARADDLLSQTRRSATRQGAPSAIGRAAGSEVDAETIARAAGDAFWGATWGYFLPAMIGHDTRGDVVRRIAELYTDYVRPSGPLPTMLLGRQPYGVLPVMSLDSWVDREGDPAHGSGVALLRELRDQVWLPSVAAAPVIRPGLADSGTALLQVLGMGESSTSSNVRSMLGNEYATYLWRFSRLKLDDAWQESRALELNQLLESLGLGDLDMPIARAIFSGSVYEFGGRLVLDSGGDTGYLDILTGSATAIRDTAELTGEVTPLLYRLLRHAALTEYDAAARAVCARHGLDRFDDVAAPEMIDLHPQVPTQTLWRRLERVFTRPGGTVTTIGDYLAAAGADPARGGDPDTARLRRFRSAIGMLAQQDSAELERHLLGAIDLAAYRLDAWLTAYATRRLDWLRGVRPDGVHLGGYGWLTDIRPRPELRAASTPAGETGPVYRAPDGAGFVHAPSLAQATTAAVLRSGYRNHAGDAEDGAQNPYALDLSSHRVRLARGLLDGIRHGHSLGTLLGYRFERGLHETGRLLDRFLPRLRELAMTLTTGVDAAGRISEVAAGTGTVDGLALHRMREHIDWRGDAGLPKPGTADHAAINAVLDDLADAIDALADTLLAESVHHAVQGNPLRAGASLDAASRGEAPPPDVQFVRTPRSGVAVTHRVLLLANPGRVDRSAWPIDDTQLRAAADPAADALAASLLPPPAAARARLLWHAPATAEEASDVPSVAAELSLNALRLSALDYVLMPGDDHAAPGSELMQRIAMAAERPPGVGANWSLQVRTDRDPAWPSHVLSVTELVQAAAAVRRLFASGHTLTNADLVTPEIEHAPESVSSLSTPALAARDAATRIAADLETSDPVPLRHALVRAAGLGITGALPHPAAGPAGADGSSGTAPGAVQREIRRRVQAADEAAEPVAVLRALFGADFPAMTECRATDELRAAYAASRALQDGAPLAVRDWLMRQARVRPGADRLHEALGYADALGVSGIDAVQAMSVAQLPYAEGDRWLGLPHGPATPTGTRVSFALATPVAVDLSAPLVGIAVDEWTEVIPNATQTTGVTFEYDAPGAMAPQSILVAVPSDAAQTWTASAVLDTLSETLDLARIRAVDPDSLGDLGQFLPALCFPVNVDPLMGATDFTRSAAVTLADRQGS